MATSGERVVEVNERAPSPRAASGGSTLAQASFRQLREATKTVAVLALATAARVTSS